MLRLESCLPLNECECERQHSSPEVPRESFRKTKKTLKEKMKVSFVYLKGMGHKNNAVPGKTVKYSEIGSKWLLK